MPPLLVKEPAVVVEEDQGERQHAQPVNIVPALNRLCEHFLAIHEWPPGADRVPASWPPIASSRLSRDDPFTTKASTPASAARLRSRGPPVGPRGPAAP